MIGPCPGTICKKRPASVSWGRMPDSHTSKGFWASLLDKLHRIPPSSEIPQSALALAWATQCLREGLWPLPWVSPRSENAHKRLSRRLPPAGPGMDGALLCHGKARRRRRWAGGGEGGQDRREARYLMLSITGVSRTRKSRCCWGFCGPFFTSPRGEGGGEKGGNRSPGSRTMCSSSCQQGRRPSQRAPPSECIVGFGGGEVGGCLV